MKSTTCAFKSIFISGPILFVLWVVLAVVCHFLSAIFVISFIWLSHTPVLGWLVRFIAPDGPSILDGDARILWLSVCLCCVLSRSLVEWVSDFISNTIPPISVYVFIFLSISIFIIFPNWVGIKFNADYVGELQTYVLIGLSSWLMHIKAREINDYEYYDENENY